MENIIDPSWDLTDLRDAINATPMDPKEGRVGPIKVTGAVGAGDGGESAVQLLDPAIAAEGGTPEAEGQLVGTVCPLCENTITIRTWTYHEDGVCNHTHAERSGWKCEWPLCESKTKVYSTEGDLRTHQRDAHGPRRFLCVTPGCCSAYSSAQRLEEHMEKPHRTCPAGICEWKGPGKFEVQHSIDNHPESFKEAGKEVILCDRPQGGCYIYGLKPDKHLHSKRPHTRCPEERCVCDLPGDALKDHVWAGYHLGSQREVKAFAEGGTAAVESLRNPGLTGPSPATIAGYRAVSDEIAARRSESQVHLRARNLQDVPDLAGRFALPTPDYGMTMRRYPVLDKLCIEIVNPFYNLAVSSPATLGHLDAAHDQSWEVDEGFCDNVVEQVAVITRMDITKIFELLRAKEVNVVKETVGTVLASHYPATFRLYAALDSYLEVEEIGKAWTIPAEFANSMDASAGSQFGMFNTSDSDIATDVLIRICRLFELTKEQFARWQLSPSGTRLKTGPTLFSRQLGPARDLVYMAIRSRAMTRREGVSPPKWTEIPLYAEQLTALKHLVRDGLPQLLGLIPVPTDYALQYRKSLPNKHGDTPLDPNPAETGIDDAMTLFEIETFRALERVFACPDQDFEFTAGTYNRDSIRLIVWRHVMAPAHMGQDGMPAGFGAFSNALRELIGDMAEQERRLLDGKSTLKRSLKWSDEQFLLMDLVWMIMGHFEGLGQVFSTIFRKRDLQHSVGAIRSVWTGYQLRWKGMSRTEDGMAEFLRDKPHLKDFYHNVWLKAAQVLRFTAEPFARPRLGEGVGAGSTRGMD